MKKIWLMLLMVCSVCAFNACSDNESDENGEDEDSIEQTIAEINMQDTVLVGQKVLVKGKEFKTTAKLYLDDVKLDAVIEPDASGMYFILPEDFQPGVYQLSAVQGGKTTVLKEKVVVLEADDVPGMVKAISIEDVYGLNETFEFVYADGKIYNPQIEMFATI